MIDISLDDINNLFLMPLGLVMSKEMGSLGDWTVRDVKSGETAVSGKKRGVLWRCLRFSTKNEAIRHIFEKAKNFYVVKPTTTINGYKPGKIIELRNPLYGAKSIEEALINLDMYSSENGI